MKLVRIFSLMAVFAVAAHAGGGQIEPKYRGKALAHWVERMQKADSSPEQYEAAEAVAAFGADADPAVPKLVEMLDDRDSGFRSMVVGLLAQIGPEAKSVMPAMIRLLKEKRARDPNDVIQVFYRMGPKANDAVPVLTDALADGGLTHMAILALCKIGPAAKEAIPAIGKAVRGLDEDSYVPERLYELGPDAVPLLCELLDEKCINRKRHAAYCVGQIGPAAKDATPRLVKMLKHDDAWIRLAAARALWQVAKHPEAVPALASLLRVDATAHEVFRGAVEALDEIGPEAKAALPALRAYLDGGAGFGYVDDTRTKVARAIEKIEGTKKSKETP